jgi:NAD-reducing hydrogenase small subunit
VKKKLATVWLDGCSGCHMSFLDMDDRLIELAEQFELVYSPIVDHKIFPQGVDISLVEGSVSTDEDEHKIRMIRERTATLVSLGDCAVTGNVPAMRNPFTVSSILERAFGDAPVTHPELFAGLPQLLPRVRPIHEVVKVDVFVPGCPPSADTIYTVLRGLLSGNSVDIARLTRFGA